MDNQEFSIGEIRERLAQPQSSKQFWRSLEEVAQTEQFQQLLEAELPHEMAASIIEQARQLKRVGGSSRRDFLKLMGAALVMTGLAGCTPRQPGEKIVPYVTAPEHIIPGKPLFYATALQVGGSAVGILAENHLGRPTKLEGNPLHPASVGGTNALVQGAIYNLYDPERARVITRGGQINTWEAFVAELNGHLAELAANEGAGLHLLTGTVTSPTMASQIAALRQRFPQSVWHQYEPVNQDNVLVGTELLFGQALTPVYDFSRAQRILALDADFLFAEPGSIRYARDFMDRRRVWRDNEMNRLYVVESTPTITGAKADHRLAMRASQIEHLLRALANAEGIALGVEEVGTLSDAEAQWVAVVARDLVEHAGAALVVPGASQPPVVHALAHAINEALGNGGNTVNYVAPSMVEPMVQLDSLRSLVEAMREGSVNTLVMIDCNPVLTAPVDFGFAEALAQVPFRVHSSLHFDETSALCHWHIPSLHELERWSDARAYDGTTTILQPLIAPLFEGRSVHELLALLAGSTMTDPYEVVRAFWNEQFGAATPEEGDLLWRTALHDGVVPEGAAEPVAVTANLANLPAPTVASEGIELNFRPDPSVWDGQYANNMWLQELPKHLSLLTWDNALLISPALAERLGIATHELVDVSFGGRTLRVAAWILPGHADDAVSLYLGYGREWEEKASQGLGFNSYALRTADAFWSGAGVELTPTGQRYRLASIQDHDTLAGRDHVRTATLEHFLENPTFAHASHGPVTEGEEVPSLYAGFEYESDNAWGMQIDLTACIGCNACTIACQVENNIPVVGKEGVLIGREMHWIKVDRYYAEDLDEPETYFQPRPCMHCEKAPCEPVCPVAATAHDHEGLNQMVYNRCVGTRYCSNNCPYKVRRFNYFDYVDDEIPLLAMGRNPDVTVRTRGVMEKCTYCVQRINQARIEAEKENRPLRDGEVLTACQQACPTKAIVFGNLNDPESLLVQQKQSPLNYGLLAELGTKPRTTYLAAVRNPNPELAA